MRSSPTFTIVLIITNTWSTSKSRTIKDVVASTDKQTIEFPTGHVGLVLARLHTKNYGLRLASGSKSI
ncbi:MAG: hypothetical protein OER82_02240 [Nitrosopumilus sp.]|nr:hypothetical protein [Nitrosopumilus sp.]MDH3853049.1 hypothetical protein [Nitrosopumilus sp.]